jgi:hypothetical protein
MTADNFSPATGKVLAAALTIIMVGTEIGTGISVTMTRASIVDADVATISITSSRQLSRRTAIALHSFHSPKREDVRIMPLIPRVQSG